MSTIERKNQKVYFSFQGKMITKTSKGWFDDQGVKFDRHQISNFIRVKAIEKRSEVVQVRSILNRFFDYDLDFNI